MPSPQMLRVKGCLLAATAFLGGCLATTSGPRSASGDPPAAAAGTMGSAAAQRLESEVSVLAPSRAGASATPVARARTPAELFDLQKAELDLMRPDGSACKAVADGGVGSNLTLMGQVGLTLALEKFTSGPRQNMDSLQSALDGVKPQLKQLSKQVVWLPVEAETLIGVEMARLSNYRDWRPTNKAQRAFVDGPLNKSFEALKSYAAEELQSPLKFQLRLVRNDNARSAEMLPGGILIVPSGLVATLATQSDAEQTLAFILAHEFSHALRRHTTKSAQGRLVDGLTMANVFTRQFKGTRQQLMALDPRQFAQMFNLSQRGIGEIMGAVCSSQRWFSEFDQTQELEADTCGALLLDKLGATAQRSFDPVAGFQRYRLMVGGSAPSSSAGKGLSCVQPASHPSVESRERNLQAYWGRLKERRRQGPEGLRQGEPASLRKGPQ